MGLSVRSRPTVRVKRGPSTASELVDFGRAPVSRALSTVDGQRRATSAALPRTLVVDSRVVPTFGSTHPGPEVATVMSVPRLLLIEDDPAIRTTLTRSLTEKGHAVASAPSAMTGLQAVVAEAPDLVVLDLGLPDLDGGTLIQMVRAVSKVPIIVATARDDEREMVRILDAGADDYVVKPFASDHLEARIRAVLRRTAADGALPPLVVGGLRIDRRSREATLDGRPLDLTRKEFDLLAYLAEHAGEVVTKRAILAEVWQQAYGGADKTVDVHLSWLRRKLGETALEPRYLVSIRGVGVKLVDPTAG